MNKNDTMETERTRERTRESNRLCFRPFRGWNAWEIAWLGSFTAISVVLSILFDDTPIGFVAFLTGVLCVVLTAKGSVWSFVYGTVNVILYAYISWRNGLYGEMGLNLFFFLPTGIAGFFLWHRNIRRAGRLVMRRLSLVSDLLVAVGCAAAIAAMGWGLSRIEGQNTPYVDATTNVLSIVATVLTLVRYREQWALYIALDVFTVLMWVIRLANGSPDGVLMTVMWTAYLVNAVYGYWNWSRGSRTPAPAVAGGVR